MQVSIDNDELEKKVAIALKGINGRSLAQAILKCIIIKAKEDEILLEATNLEIGLRVKVDGTVEEEGCCAIDGKSLADISRKMPDGDVVIQSDEKTAVNPEAALFLSHPGIKSRKAPCTPLQSVHLCSIIKVECFPFTCAISSMRN